MLKKCTAEFIGTFAIVFFGCGAVAINQLSNGALGLIGIAIVFGLVVMAMIYSFGHTSGAHINPAVTIALAYSNRFDKKEVFPYIAAQCTAALSASTIHLIVLKPLFIKQEIANKMSYGVTTPLDSSFITALVIEAILTFFLMAVILGSAVDKKAASGFAGLAIGSTVAFLILFGGPLTGASMNPARSLGPALISGNLNQFFAYLIGPTLGALGAVVLYDKTQNVNEGLVCQSESEPELTKSES